MTPDEIGTAALGVCVAIGGAWTGLQSWQAKRQAQRAAKAAHPVSNGWGAKVTVDLDYLRSTVDRLVSSVDRAHSRMDEDAKRQNGQDARLEQVANFARSAAEQSAAVATGLASHLADHTKSDLTQRK